MRIYLPISTVLLFVIFGVTNESYAQQTPRHVGDLTLEAYDFETQDGQEIGAEMGTLVVPEKRDDPNTNLIDVAFVRFKSTSENPGPPIIYLAGGPGGSGISAASGVRFPIFSALREFGDVIALDQRGTGRSKPNLVCPDNLDLTFDEPTGEDYFIHVAQAHARSCAAYWSDHGVDLSAYNTVESADDLNDLRIALGAEKMTLWGISYGTHLALATIKRHGAHIDRVLLHGVEGLHQTLKIPFETEQGFDALDSMVSQDATLSAMIPSLTALMRHVMDQLEKEPVTVEVSHPATGEVVSATVGKFHLQVVTTFMLQNRQRMSLLPLFYLGMSQGNYDMLAQSSLELARQPISAMTFAMDCASGVSDTRMATIRAQQDDALLGRGLDFLVPDVCSAWGIPDLGSDYRSPTQSTIPALFISGALDFRTPPRNADEASAGFPNSDHLMIEGAGHDDDLFVSSPEILQDLRAFMLGQPLPTRLITLSPIPFRRP